MLQAALRVMPGKRSRCKGDCNACIDMVHAGLEVATSHKRALARVYGLLLPALEDTCLSCILWMPAHKSAAHVGGLRLSNGEILTKGDVKANGMADGFAKKAWSSIGCRRPKLSSGRNLRMMPSTCLNG